MCPTNYSGVGDGHGGATARTQTGQGRGQPAPTLGHADRGGAGCLGSLSPAVPPATFLQAGSRPWPASSLSEHFDDVRAERGRCDMPPCYQVRSPPEATQLMATASGVTAAADEIGLCCTESAHRESGLNMRRPALSPVESTVSR